MNFLVKWEIDISAENQEEAAKLAWEIFKDKHSTASFLSVYEWIDKPTEHLIGLHDMEGK